MIFFFIRLFFECFIRSQGTPGSK